jgi:hypothetical protein
MALEFVGQSLAATTNGLAAAGNSLSVQGPEIWTVLSVETGAQGFLPDRRPQVLYERHIFHRLTNGQFDDGDISDPTPGGYGPGGANQYTRLARAIALNRDAALQSASWGLGQIMGQNFKMAGFPDVETMVQAMSDSEDAHLAAFASFLQASNLTAPLQAHDWAVFARGYNGPNYAINQYDTKLAAKYQSLVAGGMPDFSVRAAQLYLTFCGYSTGGVDGIIGNMTRAAISSFQTKQGLPATGVVDDALLAALTQAALAPSS